MTHTTAQASSPSPAPAPPERAWAALAGVTGVVSAAVTLAVAEVVSLLLGGIGNPILSVGSLIIDLVPPGVKTLVIDLFDTADKLVLFVALGAVVLVFAVAVGLLEVRRAPFGTVLLAVVAAVATVAAVTRAEATPFSAAPTLVGAIVGYLALRTLVSRLAAWRAARPRRASAAYGAGTRFERRSFLRFAIAAGVASAVVGAGARVMSAAARAVTDLRAVIRLPVAATSAPVVGVANTLDVPGISPFITPNDGFYRIDTALQVPSVDPNEWKLRITGMVENDVEIDFAELTALPLQENIVTLACVSNEVGGTLIGNALWLGYPIRELLKRARPMAGADMVLSTSVDGFTASTPLEVLQDENTDALLAVGMNGEPLPLDHGFPVRMVVPGLYGYVSATKWVVELEVTRFADKMGYWTSRGWTAKGPVKISSRIDTPRANFGASAGTIAVAGVAWAQHTGISRVEVSIDSGDWREATLATAVTADSWLQWTYAWDAPTGQHDIAVRATDSNGLVQTAAEAPPAPDGSTGIHRISVNVQ
ncbi:MAG: molybdopterin-dependent oxidoreductase [Burkholderiaceae bacterium]|nr:molybdopterin-dependent oxidoreductase [Microbacteriaceae bacterium]